MVLTLACGRSAEQALEELQHHGTKFSQEAFFDAVREGDVAEVKLFLDAGMKAEGPRNPSGRTVLGEAVSTGNVELVKLLLTRGARVDTPYGQGVTALVSISSSDKVGVARALLAGGANVNFQGGISMETALHRAARQGQVPMMRTLMKAGADPNLCSVSQTTPLATAAAAGKEEIIDEFLRAGRRVDLEGRCGERETALMRAVASKHPKIVSKLLEAGADPASVNSQGRTPLSLALGYQQDQSALEIIQHLVEADPHARQAALESATLYWRPKVIKAIVENGGSIENLSGQALLFWSVSTGQIPLAETAIARGAGVHGADSRGYTVLERAVEEGQTEMVLWVLDRGASLGGSSSNYHPPLWLAATRGHTEIAEILLNAGAKPNSPNTRHNTALLEAARHCDLETTLLLLRHHADVSRQNNSKETPLVHACACSDPSLARVLLQAGADANSGAIDKKNSIYIAAETRNYTLVELLLEHGADPTVPDEDGQTAALLAAVAGNEGLAGAIEPPRLPISRRTEHAGTKALMLAIYADQGDTIGRLFKAGVSPNAVRWRGDTALWVAVNLRKLKAVEALINAGADVNRTSSGLTILMHAANRPAPDRWALSEADYDASVIEFKKHRPLKRREPVQGTIIERLVQAGAKIDARDRNGTTPLLVAVTFGSVDAVKTLLDLGANPNIKRAYRETALHWAIKRGDIEIVRALLTAGADPHVKNRGDQSPLTIAKNEGHQQIVELLCDFPGIECALSSEPDSRPDQPQNTKKPAPKGRPPETLRERFLNLDWAGLGNRLLGLVGMEKYNCGGQNSTPELEHLLVKAVENGDFKSVKKALLAGAWVQTRDHRGSPVVMTAAERGHNTIIKILIRAGADVNQKGNFEGTALGAAAGIGNLKCVNTLLRAGAEVNTVDGYLRSPLHHAVLGKNLEVERALVEAGADANLRDKEGYTPISFASDSSTFRALLKSQPRGSPPVDVNVSAVGGKRTVLMAMIGDIDAVRLLLDAGANVDARDSESRTALMLAAAAGQGAIVQTLLGANANIEAKSNNGRTAIAHAAEQGQGEIIRLLAEAGARIDSRDHAGWTPLMIGLREKTTHLTLWRTRVVEALWASGVDIEEPDEDGRTPLIWAARSCDSQVVLLFLQWGARVNTSDNDGRTPLHHAIAAARTNPPCRDFRSSINALVSAGADVLATDSKGSRPIDEARNFSGVAEDLAQAEKKRRQIGKRRVLK
jgi:ankyrin repeat protein